MEFLEQSVNRLFALPESLDRKNIGLELEVLTFKKEGENLLKSVDIINEELNGSYDMLYESSHCQRSLFEPDKKLEVPRLTSKSGGLVTFEPGGQVEYSSSVDPDLSKVIRELIANMLELERILSTDDVNFFYGAINPWQTVEEVGLKMKKPRYRAMDRYFQTIGPYGQQMMRLSGSLQVNLDFGNPETSRKRWLAANLISPISCAIFGNSPLVSGKVSGAKSYRSITWQHLDRSRTGFPHLRIDDWTTKTCVEQYLEFALNAWVFLLPDKEGFMGYRENGITFRQWLDSGYNGYYPSIEDWESHLTTLFPEVRPKGFLECRFIDGQSRPCWAVPAIITTVLIYDEPSMEKVIALLKRYLPDLDKMLEKASWKGVEAFPEFCRDLFKILFQAGDYPVDPELMEYCERFYRHYTEKGKNPADELLELHSAGHMTLDQYKGYERSLFDIIQPPEPVIPGNRA